MLCRARGRERRERRRPHPRDHGRPGVVTLPPKYLMRGLRYLRSARPETIGNALSCARAVEIPRTFAPANAGRVDALEEADRTRLFNPPATIWTLIFHSFFFSSINITSKIVRAQVGLRVEMLITDRRRVCHRFSFCRILMIVFPNKRTRFGR